VKRTHNKNGALSHSEGCCFVRELSSTGLTFSNFQDTKARLCAVSTTAQPIMNAFAEETCADVQLQHGQAVNPLAPGGQIATEGNCEADMCTPLNANRKGNKAVSFRLKFTMNTANVFNHHQKWKKLKEAVYQSSAKAHTVKISGKGGIIFRKKLRDGDVFEITQGKAGFKGSFLKVQIGVGKSKALMKIGVDCKQKRNIVVGDQWGVLTVLGYTLKKGDETCDAASVSSDRAAMLINTDGAGTSSSNGGSKSASNEDKDHTALKVVAILAGSFLVIAAVFAVGALNTAEANPNDQVINDDEYNDDAQFAPSESSKSSYVQRAGTRWTLGNQGVQAPDDEVLDVSSARRIDGV
jgi:hypothetical protein